MNYPFMLIMRNSIGGCIWQAYTVLNDREVELLTKSARANGFMVEKQPVGYADETTPHWRDTQEWKDYDAGRLSERAKGQEAVRAILKPIRRDGPYWLGGYYDWLVSCFSLRNPDDLHGFTPLACWSELSDKMCKQWMVCEKDGQVYVDYLPGNAGSRGYGLYPKPAKEQTYPPHISDWIFKDVLPATKLDKIYDSMVASE